MIYLDNAATTAQKPEAVARAVYEAISSGQLGNPSRGAHDYSLAAFRRIYEFREVAASLFGVADPLRIAITGSATDSINKVLKGLLKPGDHIISSVLEHNSVLRPLYQLKSQGVDFDLVGIDGKGNLRYEEFDELRQPGTRAVVVTSASNVTGNTVDLAKLSEFCRRHELLFIVDGSQTAGTDDLNVEDLGIDVLCTTGHKSLYGPQGTGLIALGRAINFSPVFSGGSGAHSFEREHPSTMPDVFEAGTLNTPGAVGLTAGMRYVNELGYDKIQKQLKALRNQFVDGILKIPNVKIYGEVKKENHAPVVGLNIGDLSSSEVAQLLNEQFGIAVRPGAHCAPKIHEALGTKEQGIVRFSFSTFNTSHEISETLKAINELSKYAGGIT